MTTVATTVVSPRPGRTPHDTGFRRDATAPIAPALDNPGWTQVIAYEEAIGYAIGADVHDKDGISAAVGMAALVSGLTAAGRTVPDMLDDLDRLDGAHVTRNFSLRYEGLGWRERRDATVADLVANPPAHIGDDTVVEVTHLAPDVLRVDLDGIRDHPAQRHRGEAKCTEAVERPQTVTLGADDGRRTPDGVETALRSLLV